jgi:hypothetical protein
VSFSSQIVAGDHGMMIMALSLKGTSIKDMTISSSKKISFLKEKFISFFCVLLKGKK